MWKQKCQHVRLVISLKLRAIRCLLRVIPTWAKQRWRAIVDYRSVKACVHRQQWPFLKQQWQLQIAFSLQSHSLNSACRYINHPNPGTPRNSLPSDSFIYDHGWISPQGKHRSPPPQRHKYHSFFVFVLFLSSPEDMCIAFTAEEGGEGNINAREKHQLVVSRTHLDQGMYLQPRHVSRPGIEPTATVAIPARAKRQYYA